MNSTIGICGNISTGSSAFCDLLKEFEDAKVLDKYEFVLSYFPDGIEDLDYHLNNYRKYMSSVVAIKRFRKFIQLYGNRYISKSQIYKLTDSFLNKLIKLSWKGHGSVDLLTRSSFELFIKRSFYFLAKTFSIGKLYKVHSFLFPQILELSILPENFEISAKSYTSSILDAMGRDKNLVTVLDQPFEGCNPVKSFKYFENPKAIIVDRDPRDHYLFLKCFLRKKGREGFQTPCDKVEDYIKYFHLVHQSPEELHSRKDIIFLNFESLVYDYENTICKTAAFADLKHHTHKKVFFKPSHSRNNTQLFKKYKGFESDIKKIENELSEYLFPFENYPDIEPEGTMFWGSQNKKMR